MRSGSSGGLLSHPLLVDLYTGTVRNVYVLQQWPEYMYNRCVVELVNWLQFDSTCVYMLLQFTKDGLGHH
jgi:hypothetical protein